VDNHIDMDIVPGHIFITEDFDFDRFLNSSAVWICQSLYRFHHFVFTL